MIIGQEVCSTHFLSAVVIGVNAPADERLFVAPDREREDPSISREASIADIFDVSDYLFRLRPQDFGCAQVSIILFSLRLDFEYHCEHCFLLDRIYEEAEEETPRLLDFFLAWSKPQVDPTYTVRDGCESH